METLYCIYLAPACAMDIIVILFLNTAMTDRWVGGGWVGGYCWIWVLSKMGLSKGSSLFSLKYAFECGQDFGSCPNVAAQLNSPDKRHFLKFRACVFGCVCVWASTVA